ncbi:hypothetical protein BSLA_01f5781 [Burkholderia stabilis]|nr:hypothetical protein BSLA_01f5781 [Burkholderia stabilis]
MVVHGDTVVKGAWRAVEPFFVAVDPAPDGRRHGRQWAGMLRPGHRNSEYTRRIKGIATKTA